MVVVEEDAEVVDVSAAHKDRVDPADGVALIDTGLPQLAGPGAAIEVGVIGSLPTGYVHIGDPPFWSVLRAERGFVL